MSLVQGVVEDDPAPIAADLRGRGRCGADTAGCRRRACRSLPCPLPCPLPCSDRRRRAGADRSAGADRATAGGHGVTAAGRPGPAGPVRPGAGTARADGAALVPRDRDRRAGARGVHHGAGRDRTGAERVPRPGHVRPAAPDRAGGRATGSGGAPAAAARTRPQGRAQQLHGAGRGVGRARLPGRGARPHL